MRILANALALSLLLAGTTSTVAQQPKDKPKENAKETIGDRVVAFCKKHKGEKVGDGQCAALAIAALQDSGAKKRGGPDAPNDGDYVWGELVFTLEITSKGPKATGKVDAIKPGDIIQFRDSKWVTVLGNRTSSTTALHHTAVVATVDKKSNMLGIYEQNSNGKKIVSESVLRLNDLREGRIRIYRPIALESKD